MGCIGAALKTLEELELWDSLITCYRLLEKKNMAEELIQRRLLVRGGGCYKAVTKLTQ